MDVLAAAMTSPSPQKHPGGVRGTQAAAEGPPAAASPPPPTARGPAAAAFAAECRRQGVQAHPQLLDSLERLEPEAYAPLMLHQRPGEGARAVILAQPLLFRCSQLESQCLGLHPLSNNPMCSSAHPLAHRRSSAQGATRCGAAACGGAAGGGVHARRTRAPAQQPGGHPSERAALALPAHGAPGPVRPCAECGAGAGPAAGRALAPAAVPDAGGAGTGGLPAVARCGAAAAGCSRAGAHHRSRCRIAVLPGCHPSSEHQPCLHCMASRAPQRCCP